jgi:putative ATP-dependent endonuclease of OLD family
MRIAGITIKNLRSIEELSLTLSTDLTTLVGANSSGKSNILRAFELFFTGQLDGRPFIAAYDMPTWIMNAKAPAARTSIQVQFDLSAANAGTKRLWKFVSDLFSKQSWPLPTDKHLTIIRYYSRGGASGFQCVIPTKGTGQSEIPPLKELAEMLIRRVEYRYISSLKDLQSQSFQKVSEELKARLISTWAGGGRAEVSEKRENFQKIRGEVEALIQGSAKTLSDSLHEHFPEVSGLKLAMASTELEDMIGALDMFATDGHETLLRQKGSGIQGASIIHMIRILRETAPKGGNNKHLFLWNVEEPETFLHPSAQRRLAKLLREQSKNTQILLTTHSPLFVDRKNPQTNALVRRSKDNMKHSSKIVSLPAEDPMKPIRESLGTSLADSLSLHEAVVLVEGPSDATIFSTAYRRLCARKVIPFDSEYVVFVSGHGSSTQATAFTILRSWSPLSKCAAIFDFDQAGKEQGAKRIKVPVVENKDYFFLPHGTSDVVLEDLYPPSLLAKAKADGTTVRTVTKTLNGKGETISELTDWNKEQLAQYFCKHATDADWKLIENFIKNLVETVVS